MQHEMCSVADYRKPRRVVQALYEIPCLQIVQLTAEGITSETTQAPAVSCHDVSSRLLRTCPHSTWITGLLFEAGGRFQSWF